MKWLQVLIIYRGDNYVITKRHAVFELTLLSVTAKNLPIFGKVNPLHTTTIAT